MHVYQEAMKEMNYDNFFKISSSTKSYVYFALLQEELQKRLYKMMIIFSEEQGKRCVHEHES